MKSISVDIQSSLFDLRHPALATESSLQNSGSDFHNMIQQQVGLDSDPSSQVIEYKGIKFEKLDIEKFLSASLSEQNQGQPSGYNGEVGLPVTAVSSTPAVPVESGPLAANQITRVDLETAVLVSQGDGLPAGGKDLPLVDSGLQQAVFVVQQKSELLSPGESVLSLARPVKMVNLSDDHAPVPAVSGMQSPNKAEATIVKALKLNLANAESADTDPALVTRSDNNPIANTTRLQAIPATPMPFATVATDTPVVNIATSAPRQQVDAGNIMESQPTILDVSKHVATRQQPAISFRSGGVTEPPGLMQIKTAVSALSGDKVMDEIRTADTRSIPAVTEKVLRSGVPVGPFPVSEESGTAPAWPQITTSASNKPYIPETTPAKSLQTGASIPDANAAVTKADPAPAERLIPAGADSGSPEMVGSEQNRVAHQQPGQLTSSTGHQGSMNLPPVAVTQASGTAQVQAQASALNPHSQTDVLLLTKNADSAEWGKGIGERVNWMINQKLNSATIRIDPPHLGNLDVVVKVTDDVTTISIQTQHAQTRDLVDASAHRLRDFMQESGFQNVNVDVSQRQEQQQARSQQPSVSESPSEENPSENEKAAEEENYQQVISGDGLVDTFV